ncbi:MAG: ProQ/FINO family protein [Pseudomonadota bacterium]
MAASVLELLEALEARLEQTKAELSTLREENDTLRQQLSAQVQQCLPPSQPTHRSVPSEGPSQDLSQDLFQELSQQSPEVKQLSDAKQLSETHHELELPMVDEASAAKDASPPPSPQSLLNQWYERYPKAFFTGHTKPLKVGIHQDLAQREPWSGKLIRRTLANYVNLPRYIKSMREGAERIDLDGNSAGTVDKEAARHANERRKQSQGKQSQSKHTPTPAARPSKRQPPQVPNKAASLPQSAPSHGGNDGGNEKSPKKDELTKPLSLEDKLRGLQQKFTEH